MNGFALLRDEPRFAGAEFDALCAGLAEGTARLEEDDRWPDEQFRRLADAGVLGWVIAERFGGADIEDWELVAGYERLAAACLTTTFILTQRNGACQRIALSDNDDLLSELLPPLCRGESFATVGISHLTTSRQHLGTPAVRAEEHGPRWTLDGTVPWVTGADHADYVVTGGTLADGRQILAAVPARARGVSIDAPPRLLALNASRTGSVRLDKVEIDERFILAGPVHQVMKQGAGGTGSLTTSALALGATAAVIEKLGDESARRPDLAEIHRALADERDAVSRDMHQAARADGSGSDGGTDQRSGATGGLSASATAHAQPPSAESIRQRANSLVLRAAQSYLAASKGAGFVAGHPAERAVREAMFFLVWSCPQPVVAANLREFACVLGNG